MSDVTARHPPSQQIELNVPPEFIGIYKAEGETGTLEIRSDEILFGPIGIASSWNETIRRNIEDCKELGISYDFIFEETHPIEGEYSFYIEHFADNVPAIVGVELSLNGDILTVSMTTLEYFETVPKTETIVLNKIN